MGGASTTAARRQLLASHAAWAFAYVVAHLIGDAFTDPVRHIAVVWPASGVTLAALLLTPRPRRPVMLALLSAANLVTNVVSDGTIAMNVIAMNAGFCLATAIDGALGAWLVDRISGRTVTLSRVEEVLALSAAATLVNAATTWIGSSSAALFAHAPFWASYRTWWSGDLLGIVLVTPFAVAWARPEDASERARRLEAAVFLATWCVGVWISTRASTIGGPLSPRPYMLVCLLPWAALRLGLRTVTAAMLILGTAVLLGARSGNMSAFEGANFSDGVMRAQLYVALAAITGLLLSASTTEARRARGAADRSATHLTLALDAARMGTWEWDISRDAIHWSEQVKRFFEVVPGTFSGTYEGYVALIHPDDRATVVGAIQRTLEGRSSGYALEHRIVRADGSVRWLACRGNVERDASGKAVRMAGTVADTTEQQEVVERLRQTQKMEAFGQLAGGVAHDFNNVLSVIQLQAEMIGKSGALASTGQPLLDELVGAASRGTALTKQLLAFARRQVPQPKPVDLNAAVSDVTKMVGRLLGDEVRMRVELSSSPLATRADVGMLGQVIVNLAVNARDAMPAGGDLTISTARAVISDGGDDDVPPGEYASIRVSDTGTGIPVADRARLFEPFFTTKPPGKGTGLGLATVFGIARLHHGFVRVTSELGKGSTFEVLLPSCDVVPEPAAESPPPPSKRPDAKETILLVDDDDGVRKATRMLLEMCDFAVVEAKSGGEALQLWEEQGNRIDLLFTDLRMPDGLDGQQLAVELRKRRPELKVVLTSGLLPGVDLELHPGERFLTKPSTLPEMLDAVNGALGTRSSAGAVEPRA